MSKEVKFTSQEIKSITEGSGNRANREESANQAKADALKHGLSEEDAERIRVKRMQ